MGVNSLPKTVTRQRHDCDLHPGPSALESSTLTTRLLRHPSVGTSYDLCPLLSVTSRCSIKRNERINLLYGMEASFDQSYTVI